MTALFPDLVVNGETVPHTLVAAEAQNHPAPDGKPGVAWHNAARAMAVRALLLQEARRTGIAAMPHELGTDRAESEEEALVRGLLETNLVAKAPSAEAVHAEWARDPSRFRAPPLWEVSHILIACDSRDAPASARASARAEKLVRDALDNPSGFSQLAAKHSDCASKSSGGTLGQIGPGDTVPEFEAALRTLSAGEITTEPVLTRHGYHVIRMDAEAPGAELPFESVKAQISEAMEKSAWARAARDYVEGLVAAANITGVDLGREARAGSR